MGYISEGTLEELFDPELATRASVRMARAVGGHWVGDVARRTPVAQTPEAYGDDVEAWIEDRGGRRPGTARRSWSATEPKVKSDGHVEVIVDSDDYPVIIWLEYDTDPHTINVKSAKALRFPLGASFRYSTHVEHPGTTGKKMQGNAEAALEIGWKRPAEVALERAIAEENVR